MGDFHRGGVVEVETPVRLKHFRYSLWRCAKDIHRISPIRAASTPNAQPSLQQVQAATLGQTARHRLGGTGSLRRSSWCPTRSSLHALKQWTHWLALALTRSPQYGCLKIRCLPSFCNPPCPLAKTSIIDARSVRRHLSVKALPTSHKALHLKVTSCRVCVAVSNIRSACVPFASLGQVAIHPDIRRDHETCIAEALKAHTPKYPLLKPAVTAQPSIFAHALLPPHFQRFRTQSIGVRSWQSTSL